MVKDLITITELGVEEIWGQEQVLWNKKYGYAGRCDMVGIWKGKPSIIDFKTSKKTKYIKQIKDYFIQCCAYAVAHNQMFGTGIKNIVILAFDILGARQWLTTLAASREQNNIYKNTLNYPSRMNMKAYLKYEWMFQLRQIIRKFPDTNFYFINRKEYI